MPMPTTRRGRFLHYRAKAKRRRREVRETIPSAAFLDGTPGGSRATCRPRDTAGAPLQQPRDYPRRPVYAEIDASTGWRVVPAYKRFGVREWVQPLRFGWGLKTRPTEAYLHYHKRRLLWIPSLRQLPWRPYRHAQNALLPGQFYPFEFYPSGRLSYAAAQGWV